MSNAPQDAGEARAKGQNFQGVLTSLERLHGPAALESTLAALPTDVREALSYGHIVPVGWYPVRWYRELHAAARRALHAGPELPRELSRHATVRDFNGLYKLVISIFAPETVFGHAPRLVRMYWQGGTIERVAVERGYARVRFDGWRGFDNNVWNDIAAGAEGLLAVCGAKNARTRTVAGGEDQSENLDVEFRWA